MARYKTTGMVAATELGYPQCALVQVDGQQAGQRYVLEEPEMLVGCSMDCHIFINDPTLSRHHFAIDRGIDSYMIRDLDSTNGTYVNGVRIKEAYLRVGVVIRAGQLSFQLEQV